MEELVSVIIPAYNHEKYIKKCLESIINQTYSNLEILVEDDCSTDNTKEIIKEIKDKRIKKFYSKENKGVVNIVNELLDKCTGKYIAVIGSDDIWYPTKIEEQIQIFKENPKLGAVFTEADLIDENGTKYKKSDKFDENVFNYTNMTSSKRLRLFYEKGNHLCHPSSIITKKVFKDIGYYNRGFRQLHDYEYWTRLLQKYEIYIINKRLMGYRREINNDNSISSGKTSDIIRMYNELFQINNNMILNIPNKKLIEGFSDIFKNKTSNTNLELLCERYFLLLNMSYGCTNKNYAFSLIYNYDNQDELFKVLENKFNYTLKMFYDDTSSKNIIYPERIINEELTMTIEEKNKAIASLNNEINYMINSKSWKITKPIRAIRKLKK